MEYAFFFSYARNDDDEYVVRFYDDLVAEVRRLTGQRASGERIGFRDTRSIGVGEEWPPAASGTRSTCAASRSAS